MTIQNQFRPDPGKNQPDLATGNHPQTNSHSVSRPVINGQRAGLLAGNRRDSHHRREPENLHPGKSRQVNQHAHTDEEDRHQEDRNRRDQFVDAVFAALTEFGEMDLLENQAGRKRADYGGQADQPGDI